MENFYDYIVYQGKFNKMHLNDLTFAEYNCPIDEDSVSVWTPYDYIIHVLNGTKTWQTSSGTLTLTKGETAYVRKGGHIVHQHFEDGFCLLIIFINDDFKKLLGLDDPIKSIGRKAVPDDAVIFGLKNNPSLRGYFQSLMSYFQMHIPPTDTILKLKFIELIHVLAAEPANHQAIGNMIRVDPDGIHTLKNIMYQNFTYNLSLEAYATLCNRSVSSFKRDFLKCFQTTPGKWLNESRLKKAAALLTHTDLPVTQIAFECGFENLSHFSRRFRHHFAIPPRSYRERTGHELNATDN